MHDSGIKDTSEAESKLETSTSVVEGQISQWIFGGAATQLAHKNS